MMPGNIDWGEEATLESLESEYSKREILGMEKVKPSNNDPMYAANMFDYYLFENFLKSKSDLGISTFRYIKDKIWIRKENVQKLTELLCEKFGMISFFRNMINLRNENTYVTFSVSNEEIETVTITSTSETEAKAVREVVEEFHCKDHRIAIRWFYSQDGSAMDLTGTFEEEVSQDLYPFIKDFDTFVERYMNSKSNILLTIGEPGTGKTTFIKHLLAKVNTRSYLTYDERILNNDYTFASFMGDEDANAFVIEDADLFLRSRSEGNAMVSRFLNVGDGLIKVPGKKLIFSTNLPNITDIDPALIRPGRCFEIIHFRKLTRAEAQVVADNRNFILPGPEDKADYTLAEIFNNPIKKPEAVTRKMGFY